MRVALDPPGRYPGADEDPLLLDHPVRGYALRPGSSTSYFRGGHGFSIHLNERGFRDGPFDSAEAGDLRLLAVGDSFTLGLGVDAPDSWPEQLEALLGRDLGTPVAVFNAGVPGYSARQMREVVQDLLPELHPRVVLFGMNSETYWRVEDPYLFRGGQLIRGSAMTRVVVDSRGLYSSPFVKRPWLFDLDIWLNRHIEAGAHLLAAVYRVSGAIRERAGPRPPVVRPLEPDTTEVRRLLAPMLAEIGSAQRAAVAGGASFVVLLINPQSVDGNFATIQHIYNVVVTGFCRDAGIRVVDPLPALMEDAKQKPVFRTPDNYHWTREGHRVAARELERYLLGSDLLRPDAGAAGH